MCVAVFLALCATMLAQRNETLYQAQKKLVELGYSPGTPDGFMGARTEIAIKAYQKDNSLHVTGSLDEATEHKLLGATLPKLPAVTSTAAPTTATGPGEAPLFHPNAISAALEQDFVRQNFKRDVQSGNYMGPKLYAKTLPEPLVPVLINGRYVKDLRGQTVFLRLSIRNKLLMADTSMYEKKKKHLEVDFGFRSNVLQAELYEKIHGHGKVAPPGMSFHETGMAVDLGNWREAQGFMIEAGFVGGCYGLEEDLVHYSVGEITKASNFEAWKRCTLKEIPKDILKGVEKVGGFITDGHFPGSKKNQ
jgi:Putative peptidoglycan binding domain